MTLREFLALPHRFRWGGVGGDDCTTFCASWIEEFTGIDPIARLRGTYSTGDGAARLIAEAGGLIALAAGRIEPLGWRLTDSPADGDVGVILAPSGLDQDVKQIAAVRFGPLWATLGPRGVVAKKADFVAAWRLSI
jgi:hypothetical protein